MTFNTPFWIIVGISIFDVGYNMAKHGQSKEDLTYSWYISAIAAVTQILLMLWMVGWVVT